jgi:hypothetical protein
VSWLTITLVKDYGRLHARDWKHHG